MVIGSLDQPLDLRTVEPIHGSVALAWRLQAQLAADLLDDVFGLIVRAVVLAPQRAVCRARSRKEFAFSI
jgi:hypothetical protein